MKKEILTNIFIILFIILYLIAMYIIEPVVGGNIKILSLIAGIVAIIVFLIAKYKTKDKEIIKKQIVLLIIALGVILRGMYIVYTPITERQHDVYSNYDQGHLGYIYTIFETGKLPQTNDIQFYHPPLHHFISAQWLKIGDILDIDLERNLEGLQVLTAIYSSLIILVVCQILKHIKIKDIYKIIIIAITAFHPTFIIFAGLINNDILMILLTFVIILYLLKWHEEANLKNTIILALSTRIMCYDKSIWCSYSSTNTICIFYKVIRDL